MEAELKKSPLIESNNADAAHTAAKAKEADNKAVASNMREVLEDYFESRKSGRFIDIERIPFICDDIAGIKTNLNEIKGNMKWMTYIGMAFCTAAGLLALKSLGV